MGASEHLTVGIVGRAVGLKGEVEVEVISDAPERFAVGSTVLERVGGRRLTVRRLRHNRHGTVVGFVEVADRAGAEALRGIELVVPAPQARMLGPHEYWDHDLIGCEVVTAEGRELGRVADVLHAPANEVLVVHGPSGEHLIAFVAEAVRSIVPGVRIVVESSSLPDD